MGSKGTKPTYFQANFISFIHDVKMGSRGHPGVWGGFWPVMLGRRVRESSDHLVQLNRRDTRGGVKRSPRPPGMQILSQLVGLLLSVWFILVGLYLCLLNCRLPKHSSPSLTQDVSSSRGPFCLRQHPSSCLPSGPPFFTLPKDGFGGRCL